MRYILNGKLDVYNILTPLYEKKNYFRLFKSYCYDQIMSGSETFSPTSEFLLMVSPEPSGKMRGGI